jgi:hypothetical protein
MSPRWCWMGGAVIIAVGIIGCIVNGSFIWQLLIVFGAFTAVCGFIQRRQNRKRT